MSEIDMLRKNVFDNLQEIDTLNNKIKEYEINTIPTLSHNIDALVDSEDRLNNIINELEKWLEDYKSRCEKAIEYIYKLQKNDDIEIWREDGYWAYLLNILKGEDE